MKRLLAPLLALLLVSPVLASGLRAESVNAVRQGHDRRFHASAGHSRSSARYDRSSRRSHGHLGYSGFHGHVGYRSGWRYSGYYSRPAYVYLDRDVYGYGYGSGYADLSYGRPSYAANGVVLGALAGAIIGNNSGDLRHNAWRGAGYGAAAGYLIGAIADHNVRRREAESTERAATSVVSENPSVASASVSAPANTGPTNVVTDSERTPSSSMSSANGLFGR